jgi:hypothetical protein
LINLEKCLKQWKFYHFLIFSLLFYMVKNKHLFTKNLEVHISDTRSASNFHLLITNLIKYQKVALYAGIKIFKNLPALIKYVANGIQVFKSCNHYIIIVFCNLTSVI